MSDIFELLPPELMSGILEMTCPEDLLDLISASPYCFQVFATSPKRFHLASLKSAVPKPLWREFTAACFASYRFHVIESETGPTVDRNNFKTVPKTQISADRGEISDFLDQYFSGSPDAEFPILYKGDILNARRCYAIFSFFVTMFTRKASKEVQCLAREHANHYESDEIQSDRVDKEPTTFFDLSDSETIRLFRAVFRFQICCKVFRPTRYLELLGDHGAFEQLMFFLHHFEPWEVEEMTCIHQFLSDAVIRALEDLDYELESYVHEICVLVRPRYHNPRDVELASGEGGLTHLDFSTSALSALYSVFSIFRERRLWIVSTIVSKGLLYMAEFVLSDRDTQFKELRKMHRSGGDPFMVDVLEHLNFVGASAPRPTKAPVDGQYAVSMRANLASVMYGADREGTYLRIAHEIHKVPFRALGYSFWDSERLTSGLLKKALVVADGMTDIEVKDRYLWHDDNEPLEMKLIRFVIRIEDEATLFKRFGPLD